VAATADIISGGRVQMGIGGGWYEHEWEAYGYGFPSAGALGRLDEGVQIMRDALARRRVTFAGKHYQVDGAIVAPKPLQDGGPPMWIAGGGEKVTLRIARQVRAVHKLHVRSPKGSAHKSQVLADHCREVGTDYDAIVRSAHFNKRHRGFRRRCRQAHRPDPGDAGVEGQREGRRFDAQHPEAPDSATALPNRSSKSCSGCANLG
jgi:alkanesulfonate monooxygenase SsuD/methylene tetrahydromethanopterin reductase-like flavin-dependent oxidoreductase (luciferase family)